ncbi:DUF2691 family protein [Ectobacillus sp. sgz5001026]|uniref:DUF2691 family protein n=1 Tax=Ectobacillus sp. sgz5001026 TaxID=3242473 RepID=UPI0036D2E6BA
MKRGVRYQILDEKSSDQNIADILKPIPCDLYNWDIGYTETHRYENNRMIHDSIFEEQDVLDGRELERVVNKHTYLAIFAELKAFPKTAIVSDIADYEDFVNSECEIIVLLVDCAYVDVYCKDINLTEEVYQYAQQKGYTDIEYIDENDSRYKMYVW